jgi:hypothetical protein
MRTTKPPADRSPSVSAPVPTGAFFVCVVCVVARRGLSLTLPRLREQLAQHLDARVQELMQLREQVFLISLFHPPQTLHQFIEKDR